jgi:hypothetical protein
MKPILCLLGFHKWDGHAEEAYPNPTCLRCKKGYQHKPSTFAKIKITHRRGEVLTVTVKGVSPDLVAKVANKIKESFNVREGALRQRQERFNGDMEAIYMEAILKARENFWDEADESWDKTKRPG